MMVLQVGLMILVLVVLYHLAAWIVPIMAAIGAGWLAIKFGSGWLIGIGAGFLGAVLILTLFYIAMASRSLVVRLIALGIFVVPPAWAGGGFAYGMAIQSGAQGPIWPILAAIVGSIAFGCITVARLAQMTPFAPATAASSPSRPEPQPLYAQPTPEPEPKVIYYHPVPPPRLENRRGDGPIIDV